MTTPETPPSPALKQRREWTHEAEDVEQDAAEEAEQLSPGGPGVPRPGPEEVGTVTRRALVGNRRRDTADGHSDEGPLSE